MHSTAGSIWRYVRTLVLTTVVGNSVGFVAAAIWAIFYYPGSQEERLNMTLLSATFVPMLIMAFVPLTIIPTGVIGLVLIQLQRFSIFASKWTRVLIGGTLGSIPALWLHGNGHMGTKYAVPLWLLGVSLGSLWPLFHWTAPDID